MNSKIKLLNKGYLEFLPGTRIPCAVLQIDGNVIRVINNSGMFRAFKRNPHGASRVSGFPPVIGGKKIAQFISTDDLNKFEPIEYNIGGKSLLGYDAITIPIICDAYLEAEKQNALTKNQIKALEQAKIILRALAKVGITALIDEATGYQYEREYNALQELLKRYISEELMKWQSRFPRAYYKEIYRLYGWEFDPTTTRRPQYIGSFTNKYVYDLFPNPVIDEIKSRNPKIISSSNKKYRKYKYFQYLTQDIGLPQLDQHVAKLIGVMKLSDNIDDFKNNYKRAFDEELKIKESQKDI